MPSVLYHLAFAETVYEKCKDIVNLDKVRFMAGNLIPDMAAADKLYTHYHVPASVEGFLVPNMQEVTKDLWNIDDSVEFGMYCHLYFDYHFISEFLIPEFIWDMENGEVVNPRNGKKWSRDSFFSEDGLYGSYTEINQLMLRDHISMDLVNKIPEELPKTGMQLYDIRKGKTWKAELEEYMAEKKEYTGDVFDYDRLWEYLEGIARQFAEELKNANKKVTDVRLLKAYIKHQLNQLADQ